MIAQLARPQSPNARWMAQFSCRLLHLKDALLPLDAVRVALKAIDTFETLDPILAADQWVSERRPLARKPVFEAMAQHAAQVAPAAAAQAQPGALRRYAFRSKCGPDGGAHFMQMFYTSLPSSQVRDQMTGVRVCLDGQVMQYLEGPHEWVAEFQKQLAADNGHSDRVGLIDEASDDRLFRARVEWTDHVDASAAAARGGMPATLEKLLLQAPGDASALPVADLFRHFWADCAGQA